MQNLVPVNVVQSRQQHAKPSHDCWLRYVLLALVAGFDEASEVAIRCVFHHDYEGGGGGAGSEFEIEILQSFYSATMRGVAVFCSFEFLVILKRYFLTKHCTCH
jgi:hypothetical protein